MTVCCGVTGWMHMSTTLLLLAVRTKWPALGVTHTSVCRHPPCDLRYVVRLPQNSNLSYLSPLYYSTTAAVTAAASACISHPPGYHN